MQVWGEYNFYSRARWPWLPSPARSWQSPASHKTLSWQKYIYPPTKAAGASTGYTCIMKWCRKSMNIRRVILLNVRYHYCTLCNVWTLGKISDLDLLPYSVWWWPPQHCRTWQHRLNPETSSNNPPTARLRHITILKDTKDDKKVSITVTVTVTGTIQTPQTSFAVDRTDSGNVALSHRLRKLFWSKW